MADNTTLNPGAGGDTIASDDVGGVKYERVKVNFGVDGAATDVSAAAPLPVDTELSTSDLDTGAGSDPRATVGLLRAESGGATLVGSANPLPTTGPLTDAQLRAAAVPVSGTVTASGPLTDTQLRATPVPVSGTVATGALTDTQLRATPVPVSGTVTATGPLTDTQLRATPVPVSGTVTANVPAGLDVDVLTLPALVAGAAEVGKVQISDGTDVATVLPVRTQPATTEKALNTVELPCRIPTYACVTAEIAEAITIGVKEGLAIWKASAVTQDIYITELWYSFLVTTASTTGGRTTVRVSKITTAPTGGVELGKADIGGAGAAVLTNTMQVKTGGGALGTMFIRRPVEYATTPIGTMVRESLFQASTVGNGIVLRGGVADGLSMDIERVAGHTALVDQWTFGARWIEL